jgi:hypothetical protein
MIDQARLAECVSQLDAGTRALLDLSLRRAVPDEQVASVLGVDAASIPPRRARGIAQLADMMEVPGPSELAALLIAIPELPESAWGVPMPAPPFSGQISRARRARAFRRTAVAASPLVALGAVIAAIAVASGSDNGGGTGATRTAAAGAPGQAAAGPQASILSPAPRHGLPPGVPLTPTRAGKSGAHAERAAARRRRLRRQDAVRAQRASEVRHEHATPRSEPVAFHPAPPPAPSPAPVARPRPKHVVQHHHHTPPAPKAVPHPQHPSSAPAPAPAPLPAPVPAPVQVPPSTVHVAAPTTPVAPNSPGGDDDDHGCHGHGHGDGDDGHDGHDGDNGHHYGQLGEVPRGRASRFTPPGLLKHRAAPG